MVIKFRDQNQCEKAIKLSMREKYPYLELFCSVFSRIRTEYGEIRSISQYSVRMRENMDQKIYDYGLFLRSAIECVTTAVTTMLLNVLLMCYSIALHKRSPYSQIFWSECWKIWTRKTPNTDIFHAKT